MSPPKSNKENELYALLNAGHTRDTAYAIPTLFRSRVLSPHKLVSVKSRGLRQNAFIYGSGPLDRLRNEEIGG